MTFDPHRALGERLAELAMHTGADNAVVMDESGRLWAHGAELDLEGSAQQQEALALAMASTADKPLHRGGHIHLARSDCPPFVTAESFAGIYVLLLWFDGPFDASVTRALVKRALPEIEALTLSLPPPGGSSTTAGAQRGRP